MNIAASNNVSLDEVNADILETGIGEDKATGEQYRNSILEKKRNRLHIFKRLCMTKGVDRE